MPDSIDIIKDALVDFDFAKSCIEDHHPAHEDRPSAEDALEEAFGELGGAVAAFFEMDKWDELSHEKLRMIALIICGMEHPKEITMVAEGMRELTCAHGNPISAGCADCMDSAERAVRAERSVNTLVTYFRTLASVAGTGWSQENTTDIEQLVKDMIR